MIAVRHREGRHNAGISAERRAKDRVRRSFRHDVRRRFLKRGGYRVEPGDPVYMKAGDKLSVVLPSGVWAAANDMLLTDCGRVRPADGALRRKAAYAIMTLVETAVK